MTQQDTWIMHFLAGMTAVALPTIGVYLFARDYTLAASAGVCLANASYWLGRERRDHEIKVGLKAADWDTGWNVLKWSHDGQMDLLTGIGGGLIPLGLALFGLTL